MLDSCLIPLTGDLSSALQADLAKVNRAVTPWVIAYGHKQGKLSLDIDVFGGSRSIALQIGK